jgi:guanine deaminase
MTEVEHDAFLDRAVALAVASVSDGGGPFGAVVVLDGEVVGEGTNRVHATSDPTWHAELAAIREACGRLGRVSLAGGVVYSSGEPCPMCLAACYWAQVDAVHHAATRHEAARAGFRVVEVYEQLALPSDDRDLPLVHRPRQDATDLLAAWGERGAAPGTGT